MGPPTHITFRTAPEYRRILWYEWAGLVALIALMILIGPWLPPSADRPPLSERVTATTVLLSVLQLQRAVIFKNFAREHIASRVHLAFPTGHWMIDFLSYTALPGKYLLPAMIERCVPADRIVTVPLHDPPRTSQARRLALADIRSQLWRDRWESRAMFKWGIVWLVLVLFPLWIWSQWPKDHVEWLATIVSFMLVFGGLWAVLALQYILLSRFVRKRLCAQ